MKRIAVFPGSFDPFTVGHEYIVKRALPLFDKIIIAIGHNASKANYFPESQRLEWIEKIFINETKVEVVIYDGITVDFCKSKNAKFILRGLRNSTDFEYERGIGQVNKALWQTIETVYLLTLPEHTAISSSIVRELVTYGGNIRKFVPKIIADELMKKKEKKERQ